jgi:CubicO group peptidase (beta-lactamase class C family)
VVLTKSAQAERDSGAGAIDTVLDAAVRAGVAPGIVAGATTDHAGLYQGAFGERDTATHTAMTPDTVFWIASLTKAITSVAALQQVEQGRMTLDGDCGDILEELRDVPVLEGFDAAGSPRLRPAKRPITLRSLLTHTSGMTYFSWHADTARYIDRAGLPHLFTCANRALATPLAHDPGDGWNYGIGLDWVGKLVEAVTDQTLEQYFRDSILAPLTMDDTAFRIRPDMRRRLAKVYERRGDRMHEIELELPQDPEFLMGGGGLYSTVPDYLRFMRMILNDGELDGARILSADRVAAMCANQIGDLEVGRMVSTEAGGHDLEMFPGIPKKWGYGFLINTRAAPTGRSAGSLAWAGTANCYYWIDRTRKIAGVTMMQFVPFADPQGIDAALAFETAVNQTFA